jgi:hypothetical protein
MSASDRGAPQPRSEGRPGQDSPPAGRQAGPPHEPGLRGDPGSGPGGLHRPGQDTSAAPLLAALLARALPDLAVLDLGVGLHPWCPGAMLGTPEATALPPAERDLLQRFRQAGGTRPLFGFDPAADAALLAGAPVAWGMAPDRLVCLPGVPPPHLAPLFHGGPPDPLLLLPGEVGDVPAGLERGRIILLLGSAAHIRGWNLLPPPDRVAPLFEALRAAAAALAEDGWQLGGRMLSPRVASLTLLAPEPAGFAPALSLPAEMLAHDGPLPAAAGRLPLGIRLRLLLGLLPARPWTLRLWLQAGAPGLDLHPPGQGDAEPASAASALFLDGLRLPVRILPGPAGATWLEAAIHPAPDRHAILGLALAPMAGPGGPVLAPGGPIHGSGQGPPPTGTLAPGGPIHGSGQSPPPIGTLSRLEILP